MTVFVTGATGVLGQPVLRLLRDAGYSVKALCRSEANRDIISKLGAIPVDGDLFDADSVKAAMEGCDTVLHLATKIPAASDMKKPGVWEENDRIRRNGTRTLRAAANAVPNVKTIVYPSVSFFYADNRDQWMDASTAKIHIIGPLQSTRDAEQDVARFAALAPEHRGIVLRFGAFYGPSSPDSRQAITLARRGFVLPVAATSAYKSLIWIGDAASAVLSALRHAHSGIYDVVEDEPGTQAETAAALAMAVGRNKLWKLPRWFLRLALPVEMLDLLARSQRISNAWFKTATGWRPSVSNQRQGWIQMTASRDVSCHQGETP